MYSFATNSHTFDCVCVLVYRRQMVGKRKSQQGAHLAKQNSERASGKRVAPANYSDGDDDRDYELGDVQDDGSSDAASDDQLLDRNELKAKHNASQLDPAAERRRAQYRDSKRRSRNQSAQQAHAPTPLTGLRAFFGTPSAVATREGPTPGTITVDRRDAQLATDSPATGAAISAEDELGASPTDTAAGAHTPANDPGECPVCLDPIQRDATGNRACLTLPCGHCFHARCVYQVAASDSQNHGRCPVCRGGAPRDPATGTAAPSAPVTRSGAEQKRQDKAAGADADMVARPVDASLTGTSATEASATEVANGAGDAPAPSGRKRGRPPKQSTEGSSSLTTAESRASHRGASARSLGGSTHESKAARAELRRGRSASADAAATASEAPPPPPPEQQRTDVGTVRGPQPLYHMPAELGTALQRMAAARGSRGRLERRHVVGGEAMSAQDWVLLRDDGWELTRVKAMAQVITLRRTRDLGIMEALALAASSVLIQGPRREHPKALSERQLHEWLLDYARADGRIAPSKRGSHSKTESYLEHEDLKEKALTFLHENVQAARKKTPAGEHPAPPLNVHRFCSWVNDVLLKEILAEPRTKREPINERTACNWLHALGFQYKDIKKNIYHDGHERADVVRDRKEKLVMFEVRLPPVPTSQPSPDPCR